MKERIHTTIDSKILKEIKKQAIDEGLNINELIEKMWRIYKVFKEGEREINKKPN